MKERIKKTLDRLDEILLDIESEYGPGYKITSKGSYEEVPDIFGKTETRTLYDGDDISLFITRMEGPRPPRLEKFHMDMEVELTQGDLKYTFTKTGKVIEMEFQKPLFIKAGTPFSYEFKSKIMCCVFKMIK